MPLQPGSRLGPYEIVAPVGSGGMGEVYRARDPRIGRDVAIKVMPVAFAADEDRLRRFEQEARTIGALNHPNIVSIFDIGRHDGAPYVVMELLEGETLRDKLAAPHIPLRKGSEEKTTSAPLPLRRSLEYAKEIATGVAAAHDKGIVHRDLKPENIFVTRDGRVKILDFGLAKLAAPRESESTAIRADNDTAPGTVLGTVGYMSPEQVRGQQVDHRSDLFAMGAIFYEMFSGRRAFKGDSAAETMSAILHEDPPDLAEANRAIAPGLERIIRHCLEKSPEQRFQSARDLAFDLELLSSDSSSMQARAAGVSSSAKRRSSQILALAVLAFIAIAAFLAYRAGAAGGKVIDRREFQQLTREAGLEFEGTISMDGKLVAFVAGPAGASDVFVQRVDGGSAINVTKDCPLDDRQPTFSPDGSQIAFRSERDGGGIFLMGATGESVRRLSDFGFDPSWSPDGKRIVVGTAPIGILPLNRPVRSELWIIDVRTGAKKRLVEQDSVQPSWSRQGNRIAFWGLIGDSGQRDVFTVAADAPKPVETIVKVTDDTAIDWNPVWAPDGKSLYFGSDRDGTLNLWRVAIDEESGMLKGDPQPVSLPAKYSGNFSIAANGNLIFSDHEVTDSILRRPFDPTGKVLSAPQPILSGSLPIFNIDVSPDGQWIAFSNLGRQEDLFVIRSDGSEMRQLTNDPERDRGPAWTSDGKWLYFYSQRPANRYEPWRIRTDGSGLEQILQTAGESQWFPRPSPDGTMVVTGNEKGASLFDLRNPRMGPRRVPNPKGGTLMLHRWSPDSRRLAMSIRNRETMAGLAILDVTTNQLEVIDVPGNDPQWSADGRSVYFSDPMDQLMKIDLATRRVTPMNVTFDRDTPTPGRRRFVLSADERTIYNFETRREGDLWLMRVAAE